MNLRRTYSYIITLIGVIIILIVAPHHTNSSANFLRQILIPKDGQILRALFTPQDDVRQTIIELINNEQKAIQIAIYFFTDTTIANALIHAKNQRNIRVEIITDHSHAIKCPNTQIYRLYKAGIPVFIFEITNKDGIFHHKFMRFEQNIFNKTLLLTGSFNLTKMAQDHNYENILITDNLEITDQYDQQFASLKTKSKTLDKFIKKHRFK